MNMLGKMLGHSAKVDESPTFERLEVIEGSNARATARRLVRAQRAAPIVRYPDPVLTEAEEDEIKAAVSKRDHIPVEDVDLDTVETVSGEHRRRIRRIIERGERKRRRKGQRAFNRFGRTNREPQPSGHEKVVAGRARKALMLAVAAEIEAGASAQEAYERVLGSKVDA